QGQDRCLYHLGRRPRGPRRPGPRTAPRDSRLAPDREAEIDLCRHSGRADPSRDRAHPYRLRHGNRPDGRLSSNEPNLQNIPVRTEEGRKIRAAFVAEPGHKLVSLDYSQIELRIVAHVAGEEALIAAFAAGHDIHAMTASQVFGVPLEGMEPMMRRRANAVHFRIIYG